MAVDKSRAKITRRNRPSIDEALQNRAQNITAEDIENPTRSVEEGIAGDDEAADARDEATEQDPVENEKSEDKEPENKPEPEPEPKPEQKKEDPEGEDDWVDSLTIPKSTESPTPEPQRYPQPQVNDLVDEPIIEPKTDSEIEREEELERQRLERMRNLATVDEPVAKELYEAIVKPELEHIRKQYDDRVAQLSGTVSQQQRRQQEIERQNQLKLRTETNSRIMEKYPKADRILQSAEFAEFLNSRQDPYSPVSKYDILNKAYNAGDAEYVLRELDAFAETRRKPKPQASVDTNSGGTPNTGGSGKTKVMTESEYMAKRKKIMSRRHTPGELTKLYNQFRASQQ